MGIGTWLRERRETRQEIKAAEKSSYEEHKGVAKAQRQRKALLEAKARGKEKAYAKPSILPKPNPEKIASIKSALAKAGEKAATAGERVKAGEMDNFSKPPTPLVSPVPTKKKSVKARATTKRKTTKARATTKKKTVAVEKSTSDKMSEFNKKMNSALGY